MSRWAHLLGVTLGRLALVWARTWRLRLQVAALDEAMAEGPVVVALMHGELLPAGLLARGRSMLPMVSQSRDGEIIAGALTVFGFPLVRGGSSRGGAEALLRAEEGLRDGLSPVLAVDGPRGPAGVPKPGAVRLAVASRRPIVVVRVAASRAWRARSWDRLMVPWPFTTLRVWAIRLDPPQTGPWDDGLAALTQALNQGPPEDVLP
ncbi:DUF374 domain-containing protein [Myxococcota bacterium]|nr:DUF374 domain-containing protein [Myxococcota bacterium]